MEDIVLQVKDVTIGDKKVRVFDCRQSKYRSKKATDCRDCRRIWLREKHDKFSNHAVDAGEHCNKRRTDSIFW